MEADLMVAAIKALRSRTGEGMTACRVALEKHNWIADDAVEHLRCDGQAVVRRSGYKPCGCPVNS